MRHVALGIDTICTGLRFKFPPGSCDLGCVVWTSYTVYIGRFSLIIASCVHLIEIEHSKSDMSLLLQATLLELNAAFLKLTASCSVLKEIKHSKSDICSY